MALLQPAQSGCQRFGFETTAADDVRAPGGAPNSHPLCAQRSRDDYFQLGVVAGTTLAFAENARISEFYGIVIEMYFDDHPPPHFHARYGDDDAVLSIDGELLAGSPVRSMRLMRQWARLHRDELLANWQRLERDEAPRRIDPLP